MKERINKLMDELKSLKTDFLSYIVNPNIPLNERWEAWLAAPEEMKEKDTYIVHFKSIDDDDIMYDGELYHCDKYQTVKMKDVVDAFLDKISDETDLDKYNEETLAAFKEEILSLNLYSYEYDW